MPSFLFLLFLLSPPSLLLLFFPPSSSFLFIGMTWNLCRIRLEESDKFTVSPPYSDSFKTMVLPVSFFSSSLPLCSIYRLEGDHKSPRDGEERLYGELYEQEGEGPRSPLCDHCLFCPQLLRALLHPPPPSPPPIPSPSPFPLSSIVPLHFIPYVSHSRPFASSPSSLPLGFLSPFPRPRRSCLS